MEFGGMSPQTLCPSVRSDTWEC